MQGLERRAALLRALQDYGRVDVAEAARRFGTAEMTIRRDLDALVARGAARRVRGGAVSLLLRGEEPPFAVRSLAAPQAKARIGRAAAALVAEGESVVLDGGTTALEVARSLAGRRLTVMAVSMHAVGLLGADPTVEVMVAGGQVRRGELSAVGPLATASLRSLRFDTAIVGCCGLAEGWVSAHDLGDAEIKRTMLEVSARRILVADSSKWGRSATAVVCRVEDFDAVVTDGMAADGMAADGAVPAAVVAALREANVELVTA